MPAVTAVDYYQPRPTLHFVIRFFRSAVLAPVTMPDAVRITRANELKSGGPQTEGMIRMGALTDVSDQICGTCQSYSRVDV